MKMDTCVCVCTGVAIPGDTAAIETVGVETTAEAIFVIEKEAIFQVLRRGQMQGDVSQLSKVRLITNLASPSADHRSYQLHAAFDRGRIC